MKEIKKEDFDGLVNLFKQNGLAWAIKMIWSARLNESLSDQMSNAMLEDLKPVNEIIVRVLIELGHEVTIEDLIYISESGYGDRPLFFNVDQPYSEVKKTVSEGLNSVANYIKEIADRIE